MKIPNLTPEQISKWSIEEVKRVRDRALKIGAQNIVDLCEHSIAERAAVKKPARPTDPGKRNRQNATELHFVCKPKDKGVTFNNNGTAWSGTWVVARDQAEYITKINGVVCLHLARAEQSYLQGVALDWQPAEREKTYAEDGREVKTKYGVKFLLKLIDTPMTWKGNATGEKGYGYETPKEDRRPT